MKINDFFKNNKIAVIAGSAVLAVAIISGTVFGIVNHKNKADSGTFSPKGSLSSSDSDKDSSATGDSSKENTSGEAATGSEATGSEATNSDNSSAENSSNSTIEVISTPNKNNSSSASSTSSKKPATSTNTPSSSVSSTQPAASTPNTPATPTTPTTSSTPSTGGDTGGSTGGNTKIDASTSPYGICDRCGKPNGILGHILTCPSCKKEYCDPEAKHTCPYCGTDYYSICPRCGRPYGDGYNGTCHVTTEAPPGFPGPGTAKCNHYD